MSEQGIKEAVEQVQKWYDSSARMRVKEIKLLIDLAQQYLDIKGMPEEKDYRRGIPHPTRDISDAQFNEAIHLCKLAMMKEKEIN